jgi:hypothetical protein
MQEKARLTVSPSVGKVGTYFFVRGVDFQPNEEVVVYFNPPSGFERRFPPTYKPGEDGIFGFIPYDMSDPALMEVGTWELFGEGSQSGKFDKVSFEVIEKPLLTISPPTAPLGAYFVVKGCHFQPNEGIAVYYKTPSGEKRKFPPIFMSDKNGTFRCSPYRGDSTHSVIFAMEPGLWELFAVGCLSGRTDTVYFQIEPSSQHFKPQYNKKEKEVAVDDGNPTKIKILFLGANPISTVRLKLDEEIKGIQTNLKLANPTFAILKRGTAIKGFSGTGTTEIPLVWFY